MPSGSQTRPGGRVATFMAVLAIGVVALILFWPGYMLGLVPAVRAAFGAGTPGVVHLTEVHHGKGASAVGDFRSDDGRTVLRNRSIEIHGNRDQVGDTLRARYLPTPRSAPWNRPADVYRISRSYEWAYPAIVTISWVALLVWSVRRLRKRADKA
jgi:hypothetical protein